MAAQAGGAILLNYGNQGSQQVGSALLISYTQPPAPAALKTLRQVRYPWGPSSGVMNPIQVSYAQPAIGDLSRKGPWVQAEPAQYESSASWIKVSRADPVSSSPWGRFSSLLDPLVACPWWRGKPEDPRSGVPWGQFGPLLHSNTDARWYLSIPADRRYIGIFQKHDIPVYVVAPWPRPYGLAANFSVAGGCPISLQMDGSTANLRLPLSVQLGGASYLPHWLGDPLRSHVFPPSREVNFLASRASTLVPLLDAFGNQVVDKSSRDSFGLYPWGGSMKTDLFQWIPWTRYSRPLNPGWGVPSNSGGPIIGPSGTILVPIRSTYIVLNEVKLITVPGGVELPVQTATLTIDNSSWVYGFSATLPGYCLSYVMASALLTPVELELQINGEEYRVLVEKVVRNREFGRTGITVSGRGQLAYLSAPYSPVQNFTNPGLRTSQQLLDDALTTNGVSLGWTIDWQIPTWNIPANVWSFSGTYIEAALNIVESVDAWLLPDPKFKNIKVMAKYPYLHRTGGPAGVLDATMPWEWHLADPGITLPTAVVKVEGVEWVEKPAYNAVFVSGTTNGVVGAVKITGSAGDYVAPGRNHPLITEAAAAGEAGRAILGDTGRMAIVTLSLPVLSSVGVIYPGVLVKYTDGATTMLGISRSLSISSGKMEDLIQTIEIEVH